MKSFLSFLFFLSIYTFNWSQTVDYFPEGVEWREYILDADSYPANIHEYDIVYYLNGDSTVGPYTYHKLYMRGDHHYYNIYPTPYFDYHYPINTFRTLLRQEGKKIYMGLNHYYQNNLVFTDSLLYDFDLQIGDSLFYNLDQAEFDQTYMNLVGIDSIFVQDTYRKRFNFIHPSENPNLISDSTFLIEGIGYGSYQSDFGGLLCPIDYHSHGGTRLYCFAINDTSYYTGIDSPCDLHVGIDKKEKSVQFSYYPNPVTDILHIKLDSQFMIRQLTLYNLIGEKFPISYNLDSNFELILDLSNFTKGIYHLQLVDVKDSPIDLKLIKK